MNEANISEENSTITLLITNSTKTAFTKDFFETIAFTTINTVEDCYDDIEISLLLTEDKFIQNLNKEYRDMDKPTDVLAFPMLTDEDDLVGPIGDIVISLETAEKQAKENNYPLEREVAFLFIHGLLHLLGYDHETSKEEEEVMFAIQDAILDVLIENNYIA